MRTHRRAVLAGLGAIVGLNGLAFADPAQAPQRVTARRSVRIGGRVLRYRAIVAETLLAPSDTRPAAVAITTAYVAENRGSAASRPVLFAFNGGPGASSTPLHFTALGPRRFVREDGAPARVADNPHSPLDEMDLVFIDPVETGYSRVLGGADGAAYWDVNGDAQAVCEVVQDWLRVNGREASPRFLLGESYGATRAAAMLNIGEPRFDGVLLFVGSLNPFGHGGDLDHMLMLPSMAAVAAFHGRAQAAGDPGHVFDAAYDFAMSDYALALLRGSELDAAEGQRTAERLSALIGLPAEVILAHNLRVDTDFYIRELLKDRGLRIGKLDARVTGPLDAPAQRPPYDDPSFRRARSEGGATYDDYFRDLGFVSDRRYNPLNLDINAQWTFGPRRGRMPNYAAYIGAAMAQTPQLRLYAAAGYYDLAVPVADVRYALSHGGVPPERAALHYYPTGHSLFEGDDNHARLVADVRAFVRGSP